MGQRSTKEYVICIIMLNMTSRLVGKTKIKVSNMIEYLIELFILFIIKKESDGKLSERLSPYLKMHSSENLRSHK